MSCRAKAAIVARDETRDRRAGAAQSRPHLRPCAGSGCGFSERLLHGEAVSIGMVLAFGFSARLGLCRSRRRARVAAHLAEAGLPTRIETVPGGTRTRKRSDGTHRAGQEGQAWGAHLHSHARHRRRASSPTMSIGRRDRLPRARSSPTRDERMLRRNVVSIVICPAARGVLCRPRDRADGCLARAPACGWKGTAAGAPASSTAFCPSVNQ